MQNCLDPSEQLKLLQSLLLAMTCVLHFFLSLFFFLHSVKLWASAFGGEIKSIAAKYSGSQLLQKVRISSVVVRKVLTEKMEADLIF